MKVVSVAYVLASLFISHACAGIIPADFHKRPPTESEAFTLPVTTSNTPTVIAPDYPGAITVPSPVPDAFTLSTPTTTIPVAMAPDSTFIGVTTTIPDGSSLSIPTTTNPVDIAPDCTDVGTAATTTIPDG
ncbi:hypothetical protein CPC08DRAFT_770078, partial [Agrocybe pediades]